MCYCKSTELYDEFNENIEWNLVRKDSTIEEKISGKRNKENSFYANQSNLKEKFISVIENYSINLPYNLSKVDYKDIVNNPLEFHKNYISKSLPCIIKNIAVDMPAFTSWQENDYLINLAGSNEFTVDVTPDGFADSIKGKFFVQPCQIKQTIKDYFSTALKDGNISYIQKQNNNLNQEFSLFKQDLTNDVENFFSSLFKKEPDASNIWIGTKESVTSLHKDNYENIFIVLKGEKHFTLIPPVYYPFLQPSYYKDSKWEMKDGKFIIQENKEDYNIPWISINPDLEKDLTNAGVEIKKYHAIIEPGDGIYLPPLWYHQVSQFSYENDFIIGVNYWFDMEYNNSYVLYDLLRNLVDLK